MKLRCRLFGHDTMRDRRDLLDDDGLPLARQVLGLVCKRCGHWEPMMSRHTAQEHARMKRLGSVRRLKIRRREAVNGQ